MAESQNDYSEILLALNEFKAEYLVVGAHAVMFYTEPRYTKDLDIWVRSTTENAGSVYQALLRFGAPLQTDGVAPDTFAAPDVVYQIGVAPVRIDLTTHVDGLTFEQAWANKCRAHFFGVPVYVISLADLMQNKQFTGRIQDRLDAERLTDAQKRGS
jgi:hypothetical protein